MVDLERFTMMIIDDLKEIYNGKVQFVIQRAVHIRCQEKALSLNVHLDNFSSRVNAKDIRFLRPVTTATILVIINYDNNKERNTII